MILNLAVQSNAIRSTRFYALTMLRRSFGAGVKQRGTVPEILLSVNAIEH